jgi:hypothetical protein
LQTGEPSEGKAAKHHPSKKDPIRPFHLVKLGKVDDVPKSKYLKILDLPKYYFRLCYFCANVLNEIVAPFFIIADRSYYGLNQSWACPTII